MLAVALALTAAGQAPAPAAAKGDVGIQLFCEPVDGNVVWTGNQRVLHTIQDSPVGCTFYFHHYDQTKFGEDAALVVETPSEAPLVEAVACRYLPNSMLTTTELLSPETGASERDGAKYARYRFALKKLLGTPHFKPWNDGGAMISVCFDPGTADPAKKYRIFYHLENNGVLGAEQGFALKCLPAMAPGKLPKRFRGGVFTSVMELNWYSVDLLKKTAARFVAAQIATRSRTNSTRPETAHIREVDNLLAHAGWRLHSGMYGDPFSLPKSWIGDLGQKYAVLADGKTSDKYYCPRYMLTDPRYGAVLKKHFGGQFEKHQDGETIWIDFEPFRALETACVCPDCLADFAKRTGVSQMELDPPKSVLSKHRPRWIQYQCQVHADVVGLLARHLRERFPHSRIGIYDYILPYDSEPDLLAFRAGCPLDPRLLDPHVDMHGPSCYGELNKTWMQSLDLNVRTVKKEMWFYPAIDRSIGYGSSYIDYDSTLSPAAFRLRLLAAAAVGVKGMVIYPGEFIDGLFFKSIQQGMAEIAECERFYFDGQRVDAQVKLTVKNLSMGDKYVAHTAHALGKETLLTLFNFHRQKEAVVGLKCEGPLRQFVLYEPTVDQLIVSEEGRLKWTKDELEKSGFITIPSCGVRHLLIRPYRNADKKLRCVPAAKAGGAGEGNGGAALRERIQQLQTRLATAGALEKKQLHNLTIAPDGDDVVVQSPSQRFRLSPKQGGRITEWVATESELVICPKAMRGESPAAIEDLMWDMFWLPKLWRWQKAETSQYGLISASLRDEGFATVSLGILRLEEEVYLEKTYEIPEEETRVACRYKLINIADKPQRLSFWSRHCPRLGLPGADLAQLTITLPTSKGPVAVSGAQPETVYTATGVKPDDTLFPSEKIAGEAAAGEVVLTTAQAGQGQVRIAADYRQLMQYYFYRDKEVATVEWMYRPVELKPLDEWETQIQMKYVRPAP